MLKMLPILLTQVKAGNTPGNLDKRFNKLSIHCIGDTNFKKITRIYSTQ